MGREGYVGIGFPILGFGVGRRRMGNFGGADRYIEERFTFMKAGER